MHNIRKLCAQRGPQTFKSQEDFCPKTEFASSFFRENKKNKK